MDTAEAAMAYETMDHTAPNAAVVGRLTELGAAGLMLDLGAGPGHIPIGVCEAFPSAKVVAIDLSMRMLKLAQSRIAATRLNGRIQLLFTDAKRLPFEDRSFDAVYSNTTLHHIPDPLPFLREAWRVLKPHGVLLIRDLYRPPSAQRRDELVKTYAPLTENTPLQQQLLRESLDAALTPEELLAAARQVGMKDVEVTIDSDRHMTLQRPASTRSNRPFTSSSR